jgi:MoxR-like ATPase
LRYARYDNDLKQEAPIPSTASAVDNIEEGASPATRRPWASREACAAVRLDRARVHDLVRLLLAAPESDRLVVNVSFALSA